MIMVRNEYKATAHEAVSVTETVKEIINTYYPGMLNRNYGISQMFNRNDGTFWEEKGWLVDLLKRHPGYNGNLQVVIPDVKVPDIDNSFYEKFENFVRMVGGKLDIDDDVDFLFRRILEYVERTGIRYVDENAYDAFDVYRSEDNVDFVDFRKGEKITRLVGRIARKYGYVNYHDIKKEKYEPLGRKIDDWYYHYAEYCDNMSNNLFGKETLFISVHPGDFYTSCIADRWGTCYTIDTNNVRKKEWFRSSLGCRCNGTQAQMMDRCSVVVYTLKNYNGEPHPELLPKKRMCFFLVGEDKIVQSRVYPDCSEGGSVLVAKAIRETVLKAFSEMLGVVNDWTTVFGTRNIPVKHNSVAYPDWIFFDDCNVNYIGDINETQIQCESTTVCPECGTENNLCGSLFCEDCNYNDDDDWDEIQ